MSIEDFERKIELVRKASMGVPKIINIDLSIVAVDLEYHIAGNLFYIYQSPDESSYVNIKVNETREPAIPYTVHTGLETPFYRLYITTPAGQAGTIQIVYGTEAPGLLKILDNRSVTVAGVGGVLEELRGDVTPENFIGVTVTAAPGATLIMAARAARKGFSIQALSTNTGNVFLGFANTVTVGGAPGIWFAELSPGMSFDLDDYRGPIYGIATAQQIVGTGEW